MAVPKKKTSYGKKRSRSMANMKLEKKNFHLDALGFPCLPHRISRDGMYNGRRVFSVSGNKTKEDQQVITSLE